MFLAFVQSSILQQNLTCEEAFAVLKLQNNSIFENKPVTLDIFCQQYDKKEALSGNLTKLRESCQEQTPFQESASCVTRCSTGAYETSGSVMACVTSCSGMFITNASNGDSKQCITKCPDATPYYETGACVEKCTSGSYSVVTGQTQTLLCQASCVFYVKNASNQDSHQCLSKCPDELPYSDAGLCSERCASGNYSSDSGSFVCQGECLKFFVTNSSNANSKQCVDSCGQDQVVDNQECLSSCPSATPYKESASCVARCSTGVYETSGSVMACVTSCSGMFITNASNGDSKQCITKCPDATPYYETGACVEKCTSGSYSVVTGQTQTLLCQASCVFYVKNASNQDSHQCLSKCPDELPYSDAGLCSERCASGNYSSDSGSFVCQGECLKFFVTNSSNANSKQCVDSCGQDQVVDNQECLSSCPSATPYKESASCVARCSTGAYETSGSVMACVTSCSGMFITNASNGDSKQCITKCPDATPYYETGACVEKCTSGSYSVETGQTQTLLCQASCVFYVKNASNQDSHQCLSKCPDELPYSDAGLCSERCASGNYSSDSGSFVCQGECLKFFVTNSSNANSKQCVDSCGQDQVVDNQECLSSCPSATPYKESASCVARCSTGAYETSGSVMACVTSCSGMFITNASNGDSKQCITKCPDATPYYETGACVEKCTSGSYSVETGQTQTLLCQASCVFYVKNASNQDSHQCLSKCPDELPYSDAGLCSERCASGNYSSDSGSFVCQGECLKFFVTNSSNANSKQCVDSCGQDQVVDNQECLSSCPSATPYKESASCVARCSTGAYETSGSVMACVTSCSGMFITNASNGDSKQCITKCPDATPYYETGACVEKCTSGSYSVETGQTQTLLCQASCVFYVKNASNQDSHQCLSKCPDELPYSDAGLCSERCASGNYSSDSGSFVCQGECLKFFVTNSSNANSKQCVDSCGQDQVVDNQECLSSCPSATPYKESASCVARCSTGAYETSGSVMACVTSCSGMFITNASNGDSKQCITKCPDATPYYETGACVEKCTSGSYSVETGQTQTLLCQASCVFYVKNASNQDSHQCLSKCPDELPYSDAGLCSERCASGNYSSDSGSFVCQGECLKFFVTNSSNANSKQCVDSCGQDQVVDNQECLSSCPSATPYKESASCVARCSTGAYETSGSVMACVTSCSGMFIANASNGDSKQCLSSCPDATPYYETGACVEKCTSGSYSVETGQTQTLLCQASCVFYVKNASNQDSHQCLSKCPDELPYSDAGLCSERCASGNYSSDSGSFVCQGECLKFFVTNSSNANSKQCVDSCGQDQVVDNQECLSSCPSATPYKESASCVARCSTGAYETSGSVMACVTSCSGMFITNASNGDSKQCITKCPDATPYYETGACVESALLAPIRSKPARPRLSSARRPAFSMLRTPPTRTPTSVFPSVQTNSRIRTPASVLSAAPPGITPATPALSSARESASSSS
ncbi:Conserved_hypothetical protein [Hexamita inflata]|uniref:Uncharacterized protein n=1 Tax=Hexamita inflata TaxID=28002 RepID=A0ABP1ILL0_9EUKA